MIRVNLPGNERGRTPSDGYRALCIDILLDAIKNAKEGDAAAILFLKSERAAIFFDYLNINQTATLDALKLPD